MELTARPNKSIYLFGLLLAAFTILWFSNLEYRKLIKPDEGRYAEIPREMVETGDWVTPRLNGLKYFEKPPLQYWATAAAYEAFGQHQWTSRLWNALAGFAGILLVWLAGARLFGREAGRYAALLLGGSFLYGAMGRINTLDIGVSFFIMLGIVGLMLSQREGATESTRRNWMYLAWIALGLSVLSKGLMGVVLPGAALFLYSLLQRDFGVWKRMYWRVGLLLFFAVTVPWFYLVIKANPEFAWFFFYHEHIERFLTTVHHRYQPWYFFIPVMVLGMLPWSALMADTVWRTWRDSARQVPFTFSSWRSFLAPKAFNPQRFLLVWTVFVFLFFSKSDSKLPSYMLPIFPSLALLMGWQLTRISARRLFWQIAVALPFLVVILGLTFFSTRFSQTPSETEMYVAYAGWLQGGVAVWILGVAGALGWLWRSSAKLPAVTLLTFATLAAALLATSGYNTVARERSGYAIANAIAPQIRPSTVLYSPLMYEQTLPFYLKRTFTLVEFTDELEFGANQEERDTQRTGAQSEPRHWLPSLATFALAWNKDKQALAIIPLDHLQRVRDLGIPMKEIYRDSQYIVVAKP